MMWLTVTEWAQYQHYGDRCPPWVKVHMRLKTSRSLNVLHPTARLLFFMLLLTAGEHDNVIPLKRAWIAEEVSLPVQAVTRHLPALIQAGLLREHASEPEGYIASKLASSDASTGASASRVRREVEEELEIEKYRSSRVGSKTTGEAIDATRPDELLNNESHKVEPDDWAAENGTPNEYGPQPLPVAGELEALKQRYSEE